MSIFTIDEKRCLWKHGGVTRQTVYNWDNGLAMPTSRKLRAASVTLGIPCRDLLSRLGGILDDKTAKESADAIPVLPPPAAGKNKGVPAGPEGVFQPSSGQAPGSKSD